MPAREGDSDNGNLAKTAGFSLHAGVTVQAHQRRKLERLCRYDVQGSTSVARGRKPGATIARLAALVPKPRVNLTRFHGVFAPNSALRHHVIPAGRGKQKPIEAKTPAQRRAAVTWAQRLNRVFKIDIQSCGQCGGPVKLIACIEDPAVVKRILKQRPESNATSTHPARAPPPAAQQAGS